MDVALIRREIEAALPRLRPPALTRDGRLREWIVDHREQDPLHRHLSPLVALYPLDQIEPERTPALAEAAARVLDAKGPGAFGWSWAWKIALRARLGDGQAAPDLLLEATRPYGRDPGEPGPVNPIRSTARNGADWSPTSSAPVHRSRSTATTDSWRLCSSWWCRATAGSSGCFPPFPDSGPTGRCTACVAVVDGQSTSYGAVANLFP